jgi:AcrR family transcriptional regulator
MATPTGTTPTDTKHAESKHGETAGEATTATDEQRRPGRPRDPHADQAIIDATMEVLSEQGFGGFTVDAVAARAGVGKATIYRRWSSKTRLVLDAATSVLPELEAPDTGSLRGDLVHLFYQSHAKNKPEEHQRLMAAIFAEAMVNDEVRGVLAEFIEGRRGTSRKVTELALERGEIRADADLNLMTDMISGTLMYQGLLRGLETTRRRVEQLVDLVIRAFAP